MMSCGIYHPLLSRNCAPVRVGGDVASVSWRNRRLYNAQCFLPYSANAPAAGGAWPKLVVHATGADESPAAPPVAPGAPPAKKGFGTPPKIAKAPVKKKGGASKGTQKQKEEKGVLVRNADSTADSEGSTQLSRVIDVVDKKVDSQRVSRFPIDPRQAREGKVDFVRVQTWGEDEESGKLENLKVKSFSPAVTSETQKAVPFYEKLVNRLQLLESKGEMAVAQTKPLPSFDRWVFGEERYVQFLVDQRAVFQALSEVIATISKAGDATSCDGSEDGVLLGGADKAVRLFGQDLGLDRCEVLDADIATFKDSTRAEGNIAGDSVTASTQAVGYAKYLRQLGSTSVGDSEKAKDACLKFLAHVFSVYVSHLTTGMRIGAKALDNVAALRQTNALGFYRDYPLVEKDPLRLFMQTINAAGACILDAEDQEQVMEELPKAMQRTSLLLSVLAVEERVLVASD